MDGIRGIRPAMPVEELYRIGSARPAEGAVYGRGAMEPDQVNLSGLGLLYKEAQGDEESMRDLKNFYEQLASAHRRGNFNATYLADNAPESIKVLADKIGIDLEKAVHQFGRKTQPLVGDARNDQRSGQISPREELLEYLKETTQLSSGQIREVEKILDKMDNRVVAVRETLLYQRTSIGGVFQ